MATPTGMIHRAVGPVVQAASAFAGPSRLGPLMFKNPARQQLPSSLIPQRTLCTSGSCLSGHNRWSKIRHRKGAADMARSRVWQRLTLNIHAALRPPQSADPSVNPKLAIAIQRGKEGGLTKAAIDNVFARAKSLSDGSGQNMTFEALGPGGREAFVIECVTTNPRRIVQVLREIMSRVNCRFAPVLFLFEKKGLIVVSPTPGDGAKGFDDIFDIAVEAGAEDVKEVEGESGPEYEIYTPATELSAITNVLGSPAHRDNWQVQSSELAWIPNDPLPVEGEGGDSGMGISVESAENVQKAIELLEDEQDVVKVWTNLAVED